MMKHPMIYLRDPSTIKKRTLCQYPQESGVIAAVFWRSPDPKQKHHFSTRKKYPNSSLPPWLNCVTNVLPTTTPLVSSEGAVFKILDVQKEAFTFVLEQWCQPAGLCYNPVCGPMSSSAACLDLGIQYVAIEEDPDLFDAASRRLMDTLNSQARKRRKRDSPSTAIKGPNENFCGIGEDLCRFPGLRATYKCKGSRKMMHDLCDWPVVMKKMGVEDREMISVCSETCFQRTYTTQEP